MKKLLMCLCLMAGTLMAQEAKVTPLLTKELPDLPGKEGRMLIVEYVPGGSSAVHRHNADVFVYVIEGSVVMQVKGEKQMTLTAGQTFYEAPGDIHLVSKNASATAPAKFVVFFVTDKGAPTSIPVK